MFIKHVIKQCLISLMLLWLNGKIHTAIFQNLMESFPNRVEVCLTAKRLNFMHSVPSVTFRNSMMAWKFIIFAVFSSSFGNVMFCPVRGMNEGKMYHYSTHSWLGNANTVSNFCFKCTCD